MSYTRVELGLFVADALWNLCILFPVLVVFWSGSWDLVDIYMDSLFPNETVSNGMSIAVGSTILTVAYFVLPLLKEFISPFTCWSLKHVAVSRVCMYVCTVGNMLFWRGVWNMAYMLIGNDLQIVTLMTLIALVLLILLKSTVSPIGCPFGIHIDTSPDFYETSPRFRQQLDKPSLYILDVLFSVYVMNTLTVVVWAGLMKLGDVLILPHDNMQSLTVSLGAGCGVSLVVFALMLPHRAAVNRISEYNRLLAYLLDATFNIVTIVVVLLLWRGLWGLIKEQLMHVPNRVGMDWVCHAVGFFGMLCLQVAVFFRGVGCDVDGDKPYNDWPMEYFIVFYRLKQAERSDRQTAIQSDKEGESDASDVEEPLLRSTRITHYMATQPAELYATC